MFCKLLVTNEAIKPIGLKKRWPKRVTRYLAPLDFEQQADQGLIDLLGLFSPVEKIASKHELIIKPLVAHKLRHVNPVVG